jgi:metal-sulfur cluster biosynthetic enzyme
MGRVADDRLVAEYLAGVQRRKIVLAEVHSVGTDRECYVNAVVDDQLRAALAGGFEGAECRSVKVMSRRMLVAKLDKACAALGKTPHLFRMC